MKGMKMNSIKKLISLLLSIVLICTISTTCFADIWSSYFGYNAHETDYYYEATEGNLASNDSGGFVANLNKIGWQGVWGCQIWRYYNIEAGKTYGISFSIQSTQCDKYVYVKVADRYQYDYAYSFWLYLKKGETQYVNRSFTAAISTGSIIFGLGGDYGDRQDSYDSDSSARYRVFENTFGVSHSDMKKTEGQPGKASGSTDIVVTDYNFTCLSNNNPQPSYKPSNQNYYNGGTTKTTKNKIKKPSRVKLKKVKAGINKVSVSWKKAKYAAGYQVKIGSIKKSTTKRKLTVYIYNKKKVSVKVRAYTKNKKIYGAWSKKKTVKIKKPRVVRNSSNTNTSSTTRNNTTRTNTTKTTPTRQKFKKFVPKS